jgi:diguanylate cyclase (GGDEF)-like protein
VTRVLLVAVIALAALGCRAPTPGPTAAKGLLDLSTWSFDRQGPVRLVGEWTVDWQPAAVSQDRGPSASPRPPFFVVPGAWNGEPTATGRHSGLGRATHTLRVRLPDGPLPELALALGEDHSAERWWLNGRVVLERGRVGATRADEQPDPRPRRVRFQPEGSTLDLVVEVSNHFHFEGGPLHAARLGRADTLEAVATGAANVDFLIIGCMSVVALYYAALWLTRPEPSHALFAALTFVVALRTATLEWHLNDLLPLSAAGQLRVDYFTLYLAPPLYLAFLRELFPQDLSGVAARTIGRGATLFAAVGVLSLLLPTWIFSNLRGAAMLAALIVTAGVSVFVARAAMRRRNGAWLVGFGCLMVFATATHDALARQRLIVETRELLPMATAVMIVAHAVVLGRRLNGALFESERMAMSLKELNVGLETRIAERTAELERLATTDVLTGLMNRGQLERLAGAELARARRHGHDLAVLVADVDHFKAVNDTHGHEVGDLALREVAHQLQALRRAHDLLGRWGGEEFVLALPHLDREGALAAGERFRAGLAARAVSLPGGTTLTLTWPAPTNRSKTHCGAPTVPSTQPRPRAATGWWWQTDVIRPAGIESSMRRTHHPILLLAAFGLLTELAAAQPPARPAAAPSGPAPPVLPQTITRDDQGRATMRAVRVTTPMKIDGRLDELAYDSVQPASGFIQMEPQAGQPASERTDLWVFFDDDHIYVSFRAWESQPDRTVVNEMRRDSNNIRQGDSVEFAFDTFRDRRNAILFEANALGGRTDLQSTNERQFTSDWNPVWRLTAGTFEGGWTIEAAVPFKSIRYPPGQAQDWGIQARRSNKSKNEISYLTRLPPSLGLGRADFSASLYATLVGVEAPPLTRTLELKPYAIADVTTDHVSTPQRTRDVSADLGVDAKYSITQNLTVDLSYNTDFAQVEADEQQVNLTRFSLFFPEKRDFFLENQGLFTFGNNSFSGGASANASDLPLLFYSRRIGISGTREVPILGGGRLTGRVGRYSIGLVNMETKRDRAAGAMATNFSVVRLKRDILRKSSIGVLATNRSHAQTGPGSNQVYGVDGTFGFFSNLTFAGYLAKTSSAGVTSNDLSYRTQMEYGGDRYGVQLERLSIDQAFNPEVGFLRRADLRKNYAQLRFSPRPRRLKRVRKFSSIGQFTYLEDSAGRLSTRIVDGELAVELQNSDRFAVGVNDDYELLLRPFTIVPGARIPVGGYRFTTARVGYNMGQQRRLSGNVLVERGSFYHGDRTTLTFNRSRINVSSQLSIEPNLSLNWIALPTGTFTARLAGSRITYTMTPLVFASALVQYNSSTRTVSANARLRWEYRPGSELFVVYNEERDSEAVSGAPGLLNRALIVKVNRFLRF